MRGRLPRLDSTSWELTDLAVPETDAPQAAGEVRLTDTGQRAGTQVVQRCLPRPESALDRTAAHAVVRSAPRRWAAGCDPAAGRTFADWQKDGWHYEPGGFDVLVGISVADFPLHVRTDLQPGVTAR